MNFFHNKMYINNRFFSLFLILFKYLSSKIPCSCNLWRSCLKLDQFADSGNRSYRNHLLIIKNSWGLSNKNCLNCLVVITFNHSSVNGVGTVNGQICML